MHRRPTETWWFSAARRGAALLILGTLTSGSAAGPQDAPRQVAKGAVGTRVAAAIDALARIELSGAVLAAVDGKVVAAIGLGHADLMDKVPCDANTLFEIASATKQFTGAAICRLVQSGDLELDDAIADLLPNVPDECLAITVRQLLQHTSGIPGTNSRGGGDDLAAVVPIFLEGGPQHEPGTHFEYWNQGYALLAGIIERTSGDSYTEFVEHELFAPAHMEASTFNGGHAKKGLVVAVGRSSYGEPRSALAHPYGAYGFQYKGMGGAVTNVWDLWRWDRALASNKPLDKKSKAELFRPGLEEYALGWYVHSEDGHTVHHHGGGVRGFVCEVRRFVTEDGCVFVLTNDDTSPAGRVADVVEAALFDRPHTLPPLPLPTERADELAGTYTNDAGTQLVLERRGNTLHALLQWPAGQRTAAYVGLDDDGQLVLWDWREHHDVTTQAEGAISIFGQTFKSDG